MIENEWEGIGANSHWISAVLHVKLLLCGFTFQTGILCPSFSYGIYGSTITAKIHSQKTQFFSVVSKHTYIN